MHLSPHAHGTCARLHVHYSRIYCRVRFNSVHSFIHSFMHSFHSCIRCIPFPCLQSCIRAFICFHSSIRCAMSFLHSLILFSICTIIHSFVRLLIHPFIHSKSFMHSLVRSFLHPFVRSFIHSPIHPLIQSFIHYKYLLINTNNY